VTTPVAIVLKGYPRLSETFIAQEIRQLEERGLDIRLISLRHPTDKRRHPIHEEITAPVDYLPEYLKDDPGRVWRAWRQARRLPGYAKAFSCWIRDFRRDPTANRARRFGQAMVMANELADDVGWIYAHFLHTPASVARYAAMMRGLPWSCSAHAKDIWTSPDWEKREKLADCRWLTTCTAKNAEHLARLGGEDTRVVLAYHGLDLSRLPLPPETSSGRDGSNAEDPAIILSVGRAVDKKGYDILLAALSRLPEDLHWRFVHIGGGELLGSLMEEAQARGLDGRIDWMGPRAQGDVIEQYRNSDVFALACRVTANGDRDGLPNVLMEAQSQSLTCVSTTVSAIPELIDHGTTGILVPPDDADALADALQSLITDPDRRKVLGAAGNDRVRQEFRMESGLDLLAAEFGLGA
jgi:glycosyltransferase involved in cell wall biosynthesis